MDLTRRGFFKASALAAAGVAALGLSGEAQAYADPEFSADSDWKLVDTEEYTNVCCYCAGGCGSVVSVRDGKIVNVEGDPDNPINEGGLCPKGAAMMQLHDIVDPETGKWIPNPNREYAPKVRRPGASDWEPISWDDAFDEIARHIKDTRDATFQVTDENGVTVNRTEAIASYGGSQQNSEEQYLILKAMRMLGIIAVDNQARVCHSSTVAGLAPTFGRGSMTNHFSDIANTDYILTCGSNCAECHPVSMKWINRALERGAKWIVVDPRFTRTAANADVYLPIRSGTDIAFYGGMINYIFEHDRWQHEYVMHYTNISYIMNDDFDFDPETGLFNGWNEDTQTYDTTQWGYATDHTEEWDTSENGTYSWVSRPGVPQFTPPTVQVPRTDPTLQDPHCVYQIMRNHYSRYTLDTVSDICGMNKDALEQVYELYTRSGASDKSGTIIFALGQTQHTYGAQNCRSMAMIQLLLGNIGMPGGGCNAFRGEPNVQGATDMAMTVYDLPGYLHWPTVATTPSLADWLHHETYSSGYYTNKPKFMVSFLKEYFGKNATVDNDYGYDWLPKIGSNNLTHIRTFEAMRDGTMKGYFAWGMNPANSAPNAKFARQAMANLDWLVVADWFETETASFWKAPDMDPSQVQTEVYMLPAAEIFEKPGTIVNSGRWLQWRNKAVEPAEDTMTDLEMVNQIWKRVAALYRSEGGVGADCILNTAWDYDIGGKASFEKVAWAMNGYRVNSSDFHANKPDLLTGYSQLQADGSTACGIWIYSGYYNNSAEPMNPAAQPVGSRGLRNPGGVGLYPDFAFSWPNNRRVLYNRASCDPQGNPWKHDQVLEEWDGTRWISNDVPDFTATTTSNGTTTQVPPNDNAFFMRWEQRGCFTTTQMPDMPIPEFYEPIESPAENELNHRQNSPRAMFTKDPSLQKGDPDQYPLVATTYGITEHWQTGQQTRSCPVLDEIAPKQFIEIDRDLADEKGIQNGDDVRVFNNRGSVVVAAMVTDRMTPLTVNGRTVHEVGLIHHWGWANKFSTGDTVNDLTPNVGDPNSYIPEYKAFLVDIEKA